MVNPIHINPSFSARHLTVGGSDWCWVVFTVMIISAMMVFAWSKLVGLLCWLLSRHVFTGISIESKIAEHERFIISP
jgi:hypothetical protein